MTYHSNNQLIMSHLAESIGILQKQRSDILRQLKDQEEQIKINVNRMKLIQDRITVWLETIGREIAKNDQYNLVVIFDEDGHMKKVLPNNLNIDLEEGEHMYVLGELPPTNRHSNIKMPKCECGKKFTKKSKLICTFRIDKRIGYDYGECVNCGIENGRYDWTKDQ